MNDINSQNKLYEAVKKARRKTFVRTVLITIISLIIFIPAILLTSSILISKKIDMGYMEEVRWNMIKGANTSITGATYHNQFFKTESKLYVEKVIDGVPITWDTLDKTYWPIGSPGRITYTVEARGYKDKKTNRMIRYMNGQRQIDFYHPQIEYDSLPDDKRALEAMSGTTAVEFALSFDQGYTEAEVREAMGDSVDWLWVDDFDEIKIQDMNGSESDRQFVEGIGGEEVFGFSSDQSAAEFIDLINTLQTSDHYRSNGEALSERIKREKASLNEEDLRIIGVVISGTPGEIEPLFENEMIRAVTLGAVVEKYIE